MKQTSRPQTNTSAQASFLKWAGSKRRLLPQLLPLLPPAQRLIEPFVGAGNVFLATDYPEYLLADSNPVLIACFQALRDDTDAFIDRCAALFSPQHHNADAYATLRARYNTPETQVEERTALFLYINKFGYNGLYRENQKGHCNTPYGHPKSLPILPEHAMRAVAQCLAGVDLQCGDFEAVMQRAQPGDLVYCDPPYAPLNEAASFTDYGAQGFNWADQRRLADIARLLMAKGVTVVVSNHDTPATRALYTGAQLHSLAAYRSISRDFTTRGQASELVAIFTS